jgi:lipopolysaccharide transport system permease protein
LRELWTYRDLVFSLGVRDLKLRYRQTLLGVAWVVIQPVAAAGIFSFVFGLVAGIQPGQSSYFTLSLAGLVAWGAFSSALIRTSGSLVGNAQLVSKVYFPRLALPLSTLVSVLVDFAVGMLTLILVMWLGGVRPGVAAVLYPVWTGVLIIAGCGIGLALGALSVRFRDVQHMIPVVVPLLLYASPVAYPMSAVPERWRALYAMLNPLAGLLESARSSALGTAFPDWWMVLWGVGFAVLAFLAGLLAFRRMERRFADVI